MSEQDDPVATLFVVSDGTGETAAAVVRAVMLQFHTPCRTRLVGSVRRESQARRVVAEAEQASGIIVFSLVNKQVAEVLLREAERRGVVTVDLLGPMISKVAQHLRAEPRLEPGLLHGFSDEYFKRIEAVEFAVQHDDGANLQHIYEAGPAFERLLDSPAWYGRVRHYFGRATPFVNEFFANVRGEGGFIGLHSGGWYAKHHEGMADQRSSVGETLTPSLP